MLLTRFITSISYFNFNNKSQFLLIPFATMASSTVDVAKSGFSRPEMYTEKLAGTVESYDRHVFLCYKNHQAWPPRVEASDDDPLPKRIATTWKARKNDIVVKTKITVCEAREEDGFSDGDVLIFPEMIKYKGLEESNVDSFFNDVVVSGNSWGGGVQGVITGSYIFVCAHGSRDVRCGVCGPVLINKLNEEIQLRGLKDQISVMACSHVGGHKYAGNLITFSPGSDGKIMGHWYGYVTPNDVPALLDQHIAKGEIIQKLWRGQMGLPTVEHKGEDDQKKLANGGDTHKIKKKNVESNNLSNNENVVGCCQGVNGVSCCRTTTFEQNKEIEETTKEHKKQGSKVSWSWPVLQQRDILTATGILGVLAAIAVGYKFCKRSG
ncbi:altered inheritance of mitochondria protein 32 [Cicer arietinum]|uniref:Altered inheritance of mitochondria protein 32 n=1 Tax=Cicer arietinum TaxID=3827 RepID=A0A1S2XGZ5_CICAR|nr:altered inheritance of mitochondria protein 32 [Cicer arietinum]